MTPEQLILGGLTSVVAGATGLVYLAPHIRAGLNPILGSLTSLGSNSIQLGSIRFSDRSRTMPTQIMGTTGSGKTVCMEHILFADLKRGRGALIIDPKGEREFYERVKAYCKKIGREKDLSLLSATYPDESVIWNPCGLGNASELQTKFFNSAIYSEPHYAKACEAALLRAFDHLVKVYPEGFGLEHVVIELQNIAKESKEKNIEGLFYDLYNLSRGEWRRVIGCEGAAGRPCLSLLDVITSGRILFVDLPTEGKLVQSSRIGRLLTQEIILLSGLRKRHPNLKSSGLFSVFIDEFDAFGTESFISFLNKGRSSGFLVTLAHQTLSDLIKVSPTFEGQVTGNINTQIIFRLNNADDCEKLARSFGTKTVTRSTYQTTNGMSTGAASNREAQEFRVHPDEIKQLKTGRCYFVMKDRGLVRKLSIPKPVTLVIERKQDHAEVERRDLGRAQNIAQQVYSAELPAQSEPIDDYYNSYTVPNEERKRS